MSGGPKLYDEEEAWHEQVGLSRAADPLLADADLLAATKELGAAQGTDKYSAAWWKTWRKNTNLSGGHRARPAVARDPPAARPRVLGAQFSLGPGHVNRDYPGPAMHVTSLSVGDLHEVDVATLLAQKRRGQQAALDDAVSTLFTSSFATDSLVSVAPTLSLVSVTPGLVKPLGRRARAGENSGDGGGGDSVGSCGSPSLRRAESAPSDRSTTVAPPAKQAASPPPLARTQAFSPEAAAAKAGAAAHGALYGAAASGAASGSSLGGASRDSWQGTGASSLGQGGGAALALKAPLERRTRRRPPAYLSPPKVAGAVTFGFAVRGENYDTPGPGPGQPINFQVLKVAEPSAKFGTEVRGRGQHNPAPASTDAQYILPPTVGGKAGGPAAFVDQGAPRPWDAEAKKARQLAEGLAAVALEAAGGVYDGRGALPPPKEDPSFAAATFGFGCSMEEHVLYGHCLDGKCCKRSQVERVLNKRADAKKIAEVRAKTTKKATADLQQAGLHKGLREKTALHYACEKNKLDVVHELLLAGAKVDSVDEAGNTPLALAAACGHVRVAQRLLVNAQYPLVSVKGFVTRRLAPTVNVTDDQGRTPLHRAAAEGHHVIVKLLLQSGANAEVLDDSARTALDVCTSAKAFDLLRARAEIYNRRERLAGVLLKRDLIASTNDAPNRLATIAKTLEVQREVRGLEAARAVVEARVEAAQHDILHYKLRGKLELQSGDLERSAELVGKDLLDACLAKLDKQMASVKTEMAKHTH